MAQYIDKDALIAEIYALLDDKFQCNSYDETTGFQNALILIKKFLNTLDVKEVQEETVSKELNMSARCFGFQNSEALFSFRLPAKAYLVGSEVKISIKQE